MTSALAGGERDLLAAAQRRARRRADVQAAAALARRWPGRPSATTAGPCDLGRGGSGSSCRRRRARSRRRRRARLPRARHGRERVERPRRRGGGGPTRRRSGARGARRRARAPAAPRRRPAPTTNFSGAGTAAITAPTPGQGAGDQDREQRGRGVGDAAQRHAVGQRQPPAVDLEQPPLEREDDPEGPDLQQFGADQRGGSAHRLLQDRLGDALGRVAHQVGREHEPADEHRQRARTRAPGRSCGWRRSRWP